MSAVYGPRPLKRRRWTNAELEQLDQAIISAVDADCPVSLRGVYYRCVSAGAIAKTENDYKRIGRRLLELRRSGRVSYWKIADGTRWVIQPQTFDSPRDALRATARLYRRDLWSRSRHRLFVFTEKDAISGVIHPVLDEWTVPMGVLRGYASETFIHSFASSMSPNHRNVIAQLGDHDPSGVGAWESFITRTVEIVGDDFPVRFERLAVTIDQVEDLRLPIRPTKNADPRSKCWDGGSVEVDAIPASTLRAIVADFIARHLDEHEHAHLLDVEAAERESLGRLAAGWLEEPLGGAG